MARRSAEEMRSAILLQRARSIDTARFAEAAAILDQCQDRCGRKRSLSCWSMRCRSHSMRSSKHSSHVLSMTPRPSHARDGMKSVVALLDPILHAGDDARLRPVFEQSWQLWSSSERIRRQRSRRSNPMQRHTATNSGCSDSRAAAEIGGRAEMQTLRVAAQEAWRHEWTGLESLGQAYASLASGDADSLAAAGAQASDTAVLRGMSKGFIDRRTNADRSDIGGSNTTDTNCQGYRRRDGPARGFSR